MPITKIGNARCRLGGDKWYVLLLIAKLKVFYFCGYVK